MFASPVNTPENKLKLQRLVDMGFNKPQARLYLILNDFDEDATVNSLIQG